MATLKELQAIMLNIPGVSAETVTMIIVEMQRSLPGEKLYIPAPDTSKKQQIVEAAKKMPTGIVAQRYGVTQSYVCRAIKRRKN